MVHPALVPVVLNSSAGFETISGLMPSPLFQLSSKNYTGEGDWLNELGDSAYNFTPVFPDGQFVADESSPHWLCDGGGGTGQGTDYFEYSGDLASVPSWFHSIGKTDADFDYWFYAVFEFSYVHKTTLLSTGKLNSGSINGYDFTGDVNGGTSPPYGQGLGGEVEQSGNRVETIIRGYGLPSIYTTPKLAVFNGRLKASGTGNSSYKQWVDNGSQNYTFTSPYNNTGTNNMDRKPYLFAVESGGDNSPAKGSKIYEFGGGLGQPSDAQIDDLRDYVNSNYNLSIT